MQSYLSGTASRIQREWSLNVRGYTPNTLLRAALIPHSILDIIS